MGNRAVVFSDDEEDELAEDRAKLKRMMSDPTKAVTGVRAGVISVLYKELESQTIQRKHFISTTFLPLLSGIWEMMFLYLLNLFYRNNNT